MKITKKCLIPFSKNKSAFQLDRNVQPIVWIAGRFLSRPRNTHSEIGNGIIPVTARNETYPDPPSPGPSHQGKGSSFLLDGLVRVDFCEKHVPASFFPLGKGCWGHAH
jgi:hypothetical protein